MLDIKADGNLPSHHITAKPMPIACHRPSYEELDANGLSHIRPANVIGELPDAARQFAQAEATSAIASKVGQIQTGTIKLGSPVFCAFKGMTREKSKHHHESALLLTLGRDVSLDLCPSYQQAQALPE